MGAPGPQGVTSRFRRLGRFVCGLLLIGRVKVEINAAERAFGFGLAQDNGHLFIERDAMAQMRPPILVSLDRLLHERAKGAFALVRGFIEANDEFFVSLYTGGNFLFERVNRHS